jgi:hypothetical protein
VLDFGTWTTKHGKAVADATVTPDELSSVSFHVAGRMGCVITPFHTRALPGSYVQRREKREERRENSTRESSVFGLMASVLCAWGCPLSVLHAAWCGA